MFTKTGLNGRVSSFRRIVGLVLALVVMFSALPVSDAHAWSYGVSVGRPGAVSIPQIVINDIDIHCAPTISGFSFCNRIFTLYNSTGPTAFRSPASTGEQIVGAQYRLEQWDGKNWVLIHTAGPFLGRIKTGQNSYTFPAPSISPNVTKGYFRVSWFFAWTTTSGAAIGAIAVDPNLATDYACASIYRKCATAPGYFQTGGFQSGQW